MNRKTKLPNILNQERANLRFHINLSEFSKYDKTLKFYKCGMG